MVDKAFVCYFKDRIRWLNLDLWFDDKYDRLRSVDGGSWSATKVMFLMGADDIANIDVPNDLLVIYRGNQGDHVAAIETIVLSGAAYSE